MFKGKSYELKAVGKKRKLSLVLSAANLVFSIGYVLHALVTPTIAYQAGITAWVLSNVVSLFNIVGWVLEEP